MVNEAPQPIQLTLTITPADNATRITWESHSVGTRQSTFVAPFQGKDLALMARALDSVQSGSNEYTDRERQRLIVLGLADAAGTIRHDAPQRIGRALYAALDADQAGARALDTARSHAIAQGQPLALVLKFPPEAVELAALPWELVWDDLPTPLLLSGGHLVACTRHLNLPQALPPPPAHALPLRLLALSPQAGIPDQLRQEERAVRRQSLQPLIARGHLQVVADVSPATRAAVVDAIQEHRPDVVHYYGHGRYKDGQGALLFDTTQGGADWTPVDRLMTLLSGIHLVVLHACQGAMVSDSGLLTGIAPALSAAGVPLVVAMQQSIRIPAATRTSTILYRALAQGQSIQNAVNHARQALYIEEDDQVSWFVPTLYIRSRDTGPAYLVKPMSDSTFSSEQPADNTSSQEQQNVKNTASNQGAQGVFHGAVTINYRSSEELSQEAFTSTERQREVELFTFPPVGTTAQEPQVLDWSRFFTTRPTTDDVWQSLMLPDLMDLRRDVGRARVQRLKLYPRLHNGFGIGVGAHFSRALRVTVEQPFPNTGVQMWASDQAPADDVPLSIAPTDFDAWLDQLTQAPVSIEISISRDVSIGVENYLQTLMVDSPWQRLRITPEDGPSFRSVPDNAHATAFANQIGDIIRRVRDHSSGALMHLFASLPLGLEILIGLQLNACRPLQCYGYDNNSGAYYPAYRLE
jgi:hypothetical protein